MLSKSNKINTLILNHMKHWITKFESKITIDIIAKYVAAE